MLQKPHKQHKIKRTRSAYHVATQATVIIP